MDGEQAHRLYNNMQQLIHLDNNNGVEGQCPAPIGHTQVPIVQDMVYHCKLSSNLYTEHKRM